MKSTGYERQQSYEPRGRGFNSCQPHQNFLILEKQPEVDASGCFSLWVSFGRESGHAELNSRAHEAERRTHETQVPNA